MSDQKLPSRISGGASISNASLQTAACQGKCPCGGISQGLSNHCG